LPRNRWTLRLHGLLLAALYLAVPAGVFGVRPCAHHDGGTGAAETATPAGAAAAAAEYDARGSHPGHSHEHAAGHEHDDDHGCACVGPCSPVPALDLPQPVLDIAVMAAVPAVLHAIAAGHDVVPPHLHPHALPWSVGPPVFDPLS
jgi:hypothetical protein